MDTGHQSPDPTLPERQQIIRRHFELMLEEMPEEFAAREMRKHVIWYTKGLPGAVKLRRRLPRRFQPPPKTANPNV